ncbi:uncharacterized protein LOC127806315 isoform X1 [Diospyros lotus]|uniref:uncharacterized protein LOC127806315 isoform X1 n=1 Tax=Diospyros lotus TaxID=55363 RepID=UPI00225975CB|nr:uncharacterized protein LOC127806315 isoform X1 [Diospyros lotus]
MDYDFRNRVNPPYDPHQIPMYRPTTERPVHGPSSLYPRIGQPGPTGRHSSPSSSSPSAPGGLGIRVAIKPEHRISPPPQLSPHIADIPRSTFQFDFDLERKIIAEAEKESQNWSRLGLENLSPKIAESTPSLGSTVDPVVSKYIASGLSREAVPLAVASYGDNPAKKHWPCMTTTQTRPWHTSLTARLENAAASSCYWIVSYDVHLDYVVSYKPW